MAAGDSGNTKGRVPDAAFREDGSIDLTLVPDYVAVWGADGVTIGGYVEQRYLFPKDGAVSPARDEQPIPVVGDDLATIVGHLVNDKGFVPVGVGPETIPAANAVVKP